MSPGGWTSAGSPRDRHDSSGLDQGSGMIDSYPQPLCRNLVGHLKNLLGWTSTSCNCNCYILINLMPQFPQGVDLSAMFIMTSSVAFIKCFSEDLGRKCLLPPSPTSRGCESPPSSSPCWGLSDPEPVFISPSHLPKMFISCWDSDWGQQAVTEMVL